MPPEDEAATPTRPRSSAKRSEPASADPPSGDTGNGDTGDAAPEEGGKFPKDVLAGRAPQLLGVNRGLARAVLKDAPDEITIEQAKKRIQKFLDAPITAKED